MEEKWRLKAHTNALKKMNEIKKDHRIKLSDPVLLYLIEHGYDTAEKIKHFYDFDEKDIPNVTSMKDAPKFIAELSAAIKSKKEITIYADYDCDGVCAGTIFVLGLRRLGIEANCFINRRLEEGYGCNIKGMKRLLTLYPKTEVIVTVDNGIVAFDGIDFANDQGIKVLVSDHHEPNAKGLLPAAIACVDAKRLDDTTEFKEICGTTLAYKLLTEVYAALGHQKSEVNDLLSFVALATITDVMDLREENRYYYIKGKQEIINGCLPCWRAWRKVIQDKDKAANRNRKMEINETTFGYLFGPMINAPGRIEGLPVVGVPEVSIMTSLKFLCSKTDEEAYAYCSQLYEINEERKRLQEEDLKKAKAIFKQENKADNKVLIIAGDFHEGLAGIIAGSLCNEKNKPTIVFANHGNGIYKGSARSIEGFDLKKALDLCNDEGLIKEYGGHEMAAGVSIEYDKIESFEKKMCSLYEQTASEKEDEGILIDYALKPEQVTVKMIHEIETYLKPYGQGFREPVFALRDVAVDRIYTLKNKKENKCNHLKFNAGELNIVWWNGEDAYRALGQPKKFKCIGGLSINKYGDTVSPQFTIEHDRCREA